MPLTCAQSLPLSNVYLIPGLEAVLDKSLKFMARMLEAPSGPASKGTPALPLPFNSAVQF